MFFLFFFFSFTRTTFFVSVTTLTLFALIQTATSFGKFYKQFILQFSIVKKNKINFSTYTKLILVFRTKPFIVTKNSSFIAVFFLILIFKLY